MKTKNPWIAALSSILVLGGGYIYVGRALRFVVAILILVFIWFVLILGGYLSTFSGFVIGVLNLVVFMLFTIIDPALIARKTPIGVQRWYMKRSVFLLYMIAMPFVLSAIHGYTLPPHTSAARLGYDIYHATSTAMAPVILQDDYVLMDTTYYRQHLPTVGDIVVAQTVDKQNEYIRRVRVVTDSSVWVSTDMFHNTGQASAEFLNNAEVPLSNIKGRVTDILLSKDWQRIGANVTKLDQSGLSDPLSALNPTPKIQLQ